jgi:hypothetical protein
MPSTFQQNPRTAGRVIDGQAFVVTPNDNTLHSLNATGTLVWELASRPVTCDEVAGAIARRFAVEAAVAARDVAAFLDDLVARGILTRAE